MKLNSLLLLALAAVLTGCATKFSWTSSVPPRYRTVAVPTFRNESDVTELASVVTRQLLREFQREGTFDIRTPGNAAVEIQGVIQSVAPGVASYDRKGDMQFRSYAATSRVLVTVVDKTSGRILMDAKPYTAEATYSVNGTDNLTGLRDASGRLAEDLARQVVDDVINLNFEDPAEANPEVSK